MSADLPQLAVEFGLRYWMAEWRRKEIFGERAQALAEPDSF